MFASIGMCFTALAPTIDFFNYPAFLLITPMLLLSGTFFPITFLKSAQTAALALPLTHVVNIARFLISGADTTRFSVSGSLGSILLLAVIWIAIATAVFFILSINLMKKRLIR